MLEDTVETDNKNQKEDGSDFFRKRLRERKSKKTVCCMPLWHIGRNGKGFVAVELIAREVIAIGDTRAAGAYSRKS